jgi:glycosyltransferase involved in cell wall biosynthesis
MIFITSIILTIVLIRFLVALVNLIFDPRLKVLRLDKKPLISVLIPARNEETNISHILSDLKKQDYSEIEIIVYDDNSTDNTKSVIKTAMETDHRIRLLPSQPLPKNWLGKNYGCYLLAKQAKGEFLLFLDADVRVNNGLIESSVAHLKKNKLGLLSIFPQQILKSAGEHMVVPLMNVILLTLLPLVLVNKSKKASLAAANGQFMLFDANMYTNCQPHLTMKNNKVEDIAIARYLKNQKIKIDCLTGNKSISCRMYGKYCDAVEGFSKNLNAFFGNSIILSILYWMITTFGLIIIWVLLPVSFLVFYLGLVILTRIFVSIISRQSIFKNILFLIPQQISLGHLNYKTIINSYFKKNTWKGRPIN